MIANPLVRFLENHLKLVRKHSSAVIIILVLAGVVAGIYLLSSRLLAGCIELLKDLPQLFAMAKGADTKFGTGGMATKIAAAEIANSVGVDMVIANGDDLVNITRILDGKKVGTLFKA